MISIIALLIGLLLPALGIAREAARSVKCMAHLRGVQSSLSIYHDQYNNGFTIPAELQYIPGGHQNPDNWTNWASLLTAAQLFTEVVSAPDGVSGVDTPLRCPSDLPVRHDRFGMREEFDTWPEPRASK